MTKFAFISKELFLSYSNLHLHGIKWYIDTGMNIKRQDGNTGLLEITTPVTVVFIMPMNECVLSVQKFFYQDCVLAFIHSFGLNSWITSVF